MPVDTNVILEARRTGSWRALTGGYAVETVEDCVTETRTGFQHRRPELQIDRADVWDKVVGVHTVGEQERAVLAIRAGEIGRPGPCVPLGVSVRLAAPWPTPKLSRRAHDSRCSGIVFAGIL